MITAPPNTLRSSAELAVSRGITPRTRQVTAQWYEGSRWSPLRSFIWQPVQSAKRDLDRFTRWELNKAAEKLWKDSSLIRGTIKRLVTLIIGSGAYCTPKTSSPEFNTELKAFLGAKLRRPCIDNKKSFGNYQRKKMRGMLLCGESFTVKVTDPRTREDKIQGLEWHKCTAAGGKPAEKNDSLTVGSYDSVIKTADKNGGGDGIEFYETGYPKSYRFLGMDAPVPENLVIHHALIDRDEQVRGETILAAALNNARDVHDILNLEKQAVKEASSRQDIIQTSSGEYDPESMIKVPYGDTGYPPGPAIPSDDTAKTKYYEAKFAGSPVLLKTGDKYTPYVPNRPGSAWEGFMAFLANIIVLSTGLPPSLVLPIDIGGTDIRRDLQIGQKLVEIFQSEFVDDLQEIAEYFIQGGIEDRVFKTKIPADCFKLEWHFTGSLTVDRNKDSVRRELVEAGLMSWDEYFGESAMDGDEQAEKIVKEAKRRRFLITGTPETEAFKDASDFAQYLNFSKAADNTEAEPDGDENPTNKPRFAKAA